MVYRLQAGVAAALIVLASMAPEAIFVPPRTAVGSEPAAVAAKQAAIGSEPAVGTSSPPAGAAEPATRTEPATIEAEPLRSLSKPITAEVPPTSRFAWPLTPAPSVSRSFQPPSQPYGPGHRGADLVGSPGQPVLVAGDGVVVYAGPLADRGVVSVQHANGLRTSYEPVLASVRAGQLVMRGAVLGTLTPGHRGCPTPACLHWGLRQDDQYLDPLQLVRGGPVRLLPWVGADNDATE